nr:hypothetical protein CFP56_19887 [Quercus suber]
MIGSLVPDTFLQSSCEDSLKACLTRVDCNLNTEKSIEKVNALLDSVPLLRHHIKDGASEAELIRNIVPWIYSELNYKKQFWNKTYKRHCAKRTSR